MVDSPWMTLKQASNYAQVSPRTLAGWLKTGLRHSRLGHTVRVHREWVDEYLAGFSEQSNADAIVNDIEQTLRQ